MKVTVLKEFRDISSFKMIHKVGDVLEVERERADRLISLELVEAGEAKDKDKKGEDKKPASIMLFEKEFEKKSLVEALKVIGVQVSGTMGEKNLLDVCLNANESGEGEMNQDCHTRVTVAIAKFIPSLLLRPTSMGEGGMSVSWNIQGIKDYYSSLCSEYNLPNKLGSKIQILDIADYL